uniref:Peptidylprolyl isomerase n=1 Tax=Lotharella globosa TaxID=91324 RepID=A0A7S4DJB6_9EUKA
MLDYSKFDKVAQEHDEEERVEKERLREERMRKYYKEQDRKKKEWESKNGVSGHGHSHAHGESCSHNHGHGHGQSGPPPRRTGCMGCGFADPAALQQMIEDHKKMENEPPKPKMCIEEKNRKKMAAIEATREDGKKLFKAGKLRDAIKIYERGVLICNGIYDLSDEDWKAVQRHEMLLDLNVATCHLKLKEYQEAIRHCKMAISIDKDCLKAHYRMAQVLQSKLLNIPFSEVRCG